MLLEEGHFDPETALLRSHSVKNNFSVVLKNSQRHFLIVALVALKPKISLKTMMIHAEKNSPV